MLVRSFAMPAGHGQKRYPRALELFSFLLARKAECRVALC